jgi:hypothetical protein
MSNENKENNENKDLEVGGKQTTLDERTRTTGQGSNTETRPGAEPEAPGNDGKKAGAPNQGTESR